MAEAGRFRVRILSRRDVPIFGELGTSVPGKEIMYVTEFLPPGLVTIPLEEYSPEEESRRIREDIRSRMAEKPEIREV